MKKIIITLTLIMTTFLVSAQCNYRTHGANGHIEYIYVDFSLDLNNAFDINKTLYEPQGLDYDLEIGIRQGNWNPYAFYGAFEKKNYQNYGVGLDYVFLRGNERFPNQMNFEIGGGINIGGIARQEFNNPRETFFGYAIRVKPALQLNDNVSIYTKLQYQERQDRGIHGVVEVYGGLLLKLR